MPYPFIGDIAFDTITCSQPYVEQNKTRVDLTKGDKSKIFFQLCRDAQDGQMPCKFALDKVQEDGNPERRGQAVPTVFLELSVFLR